LGNGIVLRSRIVLLRSYWSWSLDWKRSSWKMISTHLESILSSGVLDSYLLTGGIDVRILSLPVSIRLSLFLELDTIVLDVSRAEATVSLEVSGFLQNGSVPGVNVLALLAGDDRGGCHYGENDHLIMKKKMEIKIEMIRE
jgi:hypothetical protein